MEEKDMKKIYEKPIIREVAFKDPIMNITALSVHTKNDEGEGHDINIGNNGGSGNIYDDARSKGGRGFWDDED